MRTSPSVALRVPGNKSLWELCSLVAGADRLPALDDLHADPGHRAAAGRCAPLPLSGGKAAASYSTCARRGDPFSPTLPLILGPPVESWLLARTPPLVLQSLPVARKASLHTLSVV